MTQIPFFPYQKVYTPYLDEICDVTRDIVSRGAFIMQADLSRFEEQIAKALNAKYAVGVGNATDGLEMLLKANEIPAGAEVIISSHTMSATASAVLAVGGVPVAVDIDELGMIDPSKIEAQISDKTWAIMPTQLNGAIAQMDEICRIARKHDLKIFEDSAQALCASLDGQFAGTFGEGGVFSFYPAKILGTIGDGGMIVTNNETTYQRMLADRDHGRDANGAFIASGRNSRLDNLHAGILGMFFEKYFDDWISHREKIVRLYDSRLIAIPEISVPKYNFRAGHKSVFQNYEFVAENRDGLAAHLRENKIGTLIQWSGNAINDLCFVTNKTSTPKSDAFFKGCLMLPLNHIISEEEASRVCSVIEEFYNGQR